MKLFNFKNLLNLLRDKFFPEHIMSVDEEHIFNTIENTLKNEKTESRIAPISDEYLIFNKEAEMIIVVQRGMVIIANHDYFLSTPINGDFQTILDTMITTCIEASRTKLKEEMLKNKVNLLEKIENQSKTISE